MQTFGRLKRLILLGLCLISGNTLAGDLLPGITDNVTCYQHGTQIVRTQNRVREFIPSEPMKLVADINLGQVSETHIRIYASSVGEVTCVLTVQK